MLRTGGRHGVAVNRCAAVLGALVALLALCGGARASGIHWYRAIFPLSFSPGSIVTVRVEANASPSTAVLELQELGPGGWTTQATLTPVLPGLEALSFPTPQTVAPLTLRVIAVASGLVFWVGKAATVPAANERAANPPDLGCPAGQSGSPPDCFVQAPSPIAPNLLTAGETLEAGAEIESSDGHYVLAMQSDGNLVEALDSGRILWSSGTSGNPGAYATVQASDGEFVVDAGDGQTIWSAGIADTPDDYVALQANADLVAYSSGGWVVWDAGVSDPELEPGETLAATQYLQGVGENLMMEGDGDLVLSGVNGALWSSGTSGNPGAYAAVQASDGDLVIDSASGQTLWDAGLSGDGGDQLTLVAGGAMAVENSTGAQFWSSETSGLGGPVDCVATPSDFATLLLTELGAPLTPANVHGVVGWEAQEGGNWRNDARFNPLNNERQFDGSVGLWPGWSPQSYADWGDGVAATIETLYNGHLNAILHVLRRGTSVFKLARAVGQSTWGTPDFSDVFPVRYDPSRPPWQPAC